MPELPEVETIRRQLEETLIGASITSIEIRVPKIFVGDPASLKGERITRVGRAGKYLLIYFKSGRGLIIHLKMTGRIVIGQSDNSDNQRTQTIRKSELDYLLAKHTRAVISLTSGRKIFFWDTRMFGYIRVEDNLQSAVDNLQKKLGPEPWGIGDQEFLRRLKKTKRAVKTVILDQSILAGVGNIYASDALWLSGIDPRRPASSLSSKEAKKLLASIVQVLTRGLATGGASDNSYVDAYGAKGSYQDEFLVYRRVGEECNRCGEKLIRVVVGGRGSWVCEGCQK